VNENVKVGSQGCSDLYRNLDLDLLRNSYASNDEYCIYDHSWRNNVIIALGTLSSVLT